MRGLKWVLLLAFLVITFACESGTKTTNTKITNTNAGNSNTASLPANTATAPAKDLKTTLAEVENSAYEAWKKKDGKFFEEFLTDNYVGVRGSGRGGHEGTVKSISDFPCDVKSTSTADEDAVELADGVVLFTGKDTSVVECDGKGTPSPLWAATVYVKDGDKWKAAYHQVAPTKDTKGENPTMPADAPKPKPLEDANKEITAKLSETEKSLWEAWAKKDTKPFEEALADNFSEISMDGRVDRAAAIKGIGEHKCEVKSHSLSDFHTSKISDDIYVLSYKGTADATCDGKPAPMTMWVSTIMKKDGDSWKGLFHMSSPAG